MRPFETSFARSEVMASGCSSADGKLLQCCIRLRSPVNCSRTPLRMPSIAVSTAVRLGWCLSSVTHSGALRQRGSGIDASDNGGVFGARRGSGDCFVCGAGAVGRHIGLAGRRVGVATAVTRFPHCRRVCAWGIPREGAVCCN
jgi:hypothetical protein